MRTYKTVKKTITDKKLVEHRCDLCGSAIGKDLDCYEFDHVLVQRERGRRWPDATGEEQSTSFDICPACFDTKLVPWLKSQGAQPSEEKRDW